MDAPGVDAQSASDDDDDDYIQGIRVDSSGEPQVRLANRGAKLLPAIRENDLELDSTSRNIINVDLLAADSEDLRATLAPIRDPAAFEALFKADIDPGRKRPLSRGMLKHDQPLRDFDVITDPDPSLATGMILMIWCVLFLVKKKNGKGRLVIDARNINRRQERPGDMGLPSILTLIRTILSWDVAAKCDGKSYFYQFPLHRRVSQYFRARLADWRGRIVEVVLKRLPMGWSFSPRIAQRTSNWLARGVGVAWLDDFIIGGRADEAENNRRVFLARLERYNVEVDDASLTLSADLHALGLQFDLKEKRYRLSPDWVVKQNNRWTTHDLETGSVRAHLSVLGGLIWADYVRQRPLWLRAECLDALSALARLSQGDLDAPATFPLAARANLKAWQADVSDNPWFQPPEDHDAEDHHALLFADASSTAIAWARVMDNTVEDGDAWGREDPGHIFLAELEALCASARARCCKKDLHLTDNAAVNAVIHRGHSSVFPANVMLRKTFGAERPKSKWIPTHLQLADQWTRGISLPPMPSRLSAGEQLMVQAALTTPKGNRDPEANPTELSLCATTGCHPA